MTPVPSFFDAPNCGLAYPKQLRYMGLWYSSNQKVSNDRDIRFVELCDSTPGSVDQIFHVLVLCTNIKMDGVDAGSVVAHMVDLHSGWDGTTKHHECCSVGSVVSTIPTKFSITKPVFASNPFPAFVSRLYFDLGKKFAFKRTVPLSLESSRKLHATLSTNSDHLRLRHSKPSLSQKLYRSQV